MKTTYHITTLSSHITTSHIHTSPCPHSWVTNLKLHHPQGLTLHCGSKHPSSNQDCQHLWWQGISLDPKCRTTRNIQSPKAGAKGQFDKGYLGVWSHLASFSVFWRCNRSPNVWAAQWSNWSIMKRVLSASVSISGLSVSCWQSQSPSFIDPWPINLTFSTKHTFIHSFPRKVVLPRNWSMCFHPFATVPNRMEMQVPKLPKVGVAGDFPQPMAVLPGMNSGWVHTQETQSLGENPWNFMDLWISLLFLFACDKWPWSMIKID